MATVFPFPMASGALAVSGKRFFEALLGFCRAAELQLVPTCCRSLKCDSAAVWRAGASWVHRRVGSEPDLKSADEFKGTRTRTRRARSTVQPAACGPALAAVVTERVRSRHSESPLFCDRFSKLWDLRISGGSKEVGEGEGPRESGLHTGLLNKLFQRHQEQEDLARG